MSLVMHKYTLLCETSGLGLESFEKFLVHKIAIVSTIQFKFFIDFVRFNNYLVDNSSIYHYAIASLLLCAKKKRLMQN